MVQRLPVSDLLLPATPASLPSSPSKPSSSPTTSPPTSPSTTPPSPTPTSSPPSPSRVHGVQSFLALSPRRQLHGLLLELRCVLLRLPPQRSRFAPPLLLRSSTVTVLRFFNLREREKRTFGCRFASFSREKCSQNLDNGGRTFNSSAMSGCGKTFDNLRQPWQQSSGDRKL
ncbi:hypothetical protein V8G54_019656 [Vigna mungo]|uniref:Uncharacterized protein n=1 Tax=Vigna mungo TaxID=3915 RepID=A0AAQ3NC72_VIGMU